MTRIHRVISSFQLLKSDSSQFKIRHFSTKDISRATFGHSSILGEDSNGNIYKAQFPDGLIATVRKAASAESRSRSSFYREVEFLGRLHHRHLVGLRGFSDSHDDDDADDDRFLVFDYMGNGSLKDWLHDPLKTPLDWRTRLHIAISVAAALEYLMFFSNPPPTVAKDFSIASTNIFLDDNFVTKICHVGGSLGYGSGSGSGTTPSRLCGGDVMFQYGVLLLELITGQSFESEGEDLMKWIQDTGFSSMIQKMVDSDLGENYDFGEVRRLLNIARLCTTTTTDGDQPKISIRQILRTNERQHPS